MLIVTSLSTKCMWVSANKVNIMGLKINSVEKSKLSNLCVKIRIYNWNRKGLITGNYNSDSGIITCLIGFECLA